MNILTQKLSTLKLSGVKMALQQQVEQENLYLEQSLKERLSLLLSHEISEIENITTQTKFRIKANLQELDHSARHQLSKDKIRLLSTWRVI